ncbi:ABC transporter permease [bacterium]|nr:ABC transporter permease [bacterium]
MSESTHHAPGMALRNALGWVRIGSKQTLAVFRTLGKVLRQRRGIVLRHWEHAAWLGMPIVAAAGFSVGVVTWFQIREILRTYGAEGNLPSLVAAAIVIQTGPILTGLICAARLGASTAAELSTMSLTEEVDALSAMGVNVTETLLTPRFVAMALALPVLTIVMDISSIAGAMTAEYAWGDMGVEAFLDRSLDLLTLGRVLPATLKTAVFGGLMALIAGCAGLNCPREAEAVGQAALKGVVGSICAVLAADMVMVPTIQWATRTLFTMY